MASRKTKVVASRAALISALAISALLVAGCSRGPRHVLLNETATTLGSHKMTIKPVGRWHSDIFGGEQQDTDGKQMWVFSAGATKIIVKDEQLSVNGKSYGKLNAGDHVDVAFDKVFVNDKQVAENGTLASR
jgi:hypothetical protein